MRLTGVIDTRGLREVLRLKTDYVEISAYSLLTAKQSYKQTMVKKGTFVNSF